MSVCPMIRHLEFIHVSFSFVVGTLVDSLRLEWEDHQYTRRIVGNRVRRAIKPRAGCHTVMNTSRTGRKMQNTGWVVGAGR